MREKRENMLKILPAQFSVLLKIKKLRPFILNFLNRNETKNQNKGKKQTSRNNKQSIDKTTIYT